MPESHDFYLSRVPVIGADRRFMGWELNLGSAGGENLSRSSSAHNEYADAFARFASIDSWDTLLCGGRAIVRADRSLLFSEAMEALPQGRIVLSLPGDFEPDAAAVSRLHTLHRQRGMRLLLSDYDRRDPREELLELVDMVHVNTSTGDEVSQGKLVRRGKRRSLEVLARGVHQTSDFEKLRGLGFGLFLGQHYCDESAGEERTANVDGQSLLRLMLDARAGLDLSEVTRQIEATPQLSEGLLQLVNSLALARAQKIDSIHQALILIGVDGLGRWLNLLLFRYGAAGGERGPLFRVAASRARLIELLVTDGQVDDPERKVDGSTAFLVGMLSFVHVLLGVDRKTAVENFGLPDDLRQALLTYEGTFGRLLWLAESLDQGHFAEVAEVVGELSIDSHRLWAAQREAYAWVYRMA